MVRSGRCDDVVHLVRVCCAHIMLMTVYRNVVQIDNGRPLHVGAEQHHTNHEAHVSNVTAGAFFRNLILEAQPQFVPITAASPRRTARLRR